MGGVCCGVPASETIGWGGGTDKKQTRIVEWTHVCRLCFLAIYRLAELRWTHYNVDILLEWCPLRRSTNVFCCNVGPLCYLFSILNKFLNRFNFDCYWIEIKPNSTQLKRILQNFVLNWLLKFYSIYFR